MNNINLNLLKYFYEVVNERNITKASQKLLVSQPAITKAIKELEQELNTTLLERNKKGVIPTEEGMILHEHTKEMLNNMEKTLNIIETNKKGGTLYIGTTTTNFGLFVQDILKKFRDDHPDIHISIVKDSIEVMKDYAKVGKLDILIKNSYQEIDNFVNVKDFTIQDKFVGAKKYYPELENKKYTLKELLENYPLVLLTRDYHHGRRNFDEYLRSKNIDYKPTYEFGSYVLCRELIKDGFGIGIGNPVNYKDKEYVIINTNFDLPIRIFNIGYINTSKNKILNEFIKYIK